MQNNIEKRYSFSFDDNIQFRAQADSGDSRHIRGYGIVFNQRSKILTEWISEKQEWRSFFETISPFAFNGILGNGFDTVLDVNHNFEEILARIASGTLTLTKDDKGIFYDFESPTTSRGEDVLQMIKRGDYYESSFAFTIAEGGDEWVKDEETGLYLRTITKIETLYDMAICTYRGAYNNTSIENISNDSASRVFEYDKKDIEVASKRLNELYNNIPEVIEDKTNKRKLDEDFITRIYLKRNWERRKISQKTL
jgi:HK97 family phage prohead protease